MNCGKKVVGIDLGTTNSCVAVYMNNMVEIVHDANRRTFPSCVGFTDTGRIYGEYAKKQMATNFKNVIYDAKRLIGHTFNDTVVQEDMKSWPFKLVEGEKGNPLFEVQYRGRIERFSPEQISSFLLEFLVSKAVDFTNRDINNIVITVPAYFNNSQRKATMDAGEIAGFNVLGVLNEPTAAAIAYGFQNKGNEKRILVYDLGGGTFDVTLLHLHDNNYDVLGTDGDSHLGGDDLDVILTQLLLKKAQEAGDPIDHKDKRYLSLLRKKAEEVKIDLSTVTETEVDEDWLCCEVTRDEFMEETTEFFQRTMDITDRLLHSVNIRPSDVDDVVLIGGSSRIPKVKELLSQKFGANKIYGTINPDEAVAHGACIYALKKMEELSQNNQDDSEDYSDSESESEPILQGDSIYTAATIGQIIIRDVIPLSIGVKNSEHMLSVILPKNTPFGESRSREFQTSRDNARRMRIHVGQGERALFRDNYEVGVLNFAFPPLPRGEVIVTITLSTDLNGVLSITASDNLGSQSLVHTFEHSSTYLSLQDIQAMQEEAERLREEDKLLKKLAGLRSELDGDIYSIHRLASNKEDLSEEFAAYLNGFLERMEKVLMENNQTLDEMNKYLDEAEEIKMKLSS